MLLRKLLFLMFAIGLGWLVQRLVNAGARGVRHASQTPVRGRQGKSVSMVRDRVCNTFLPESNALVSTIAGEKHYFCSERCRRKFLEGAPVPTTTVS